MERRGGSLGARILIGVALALLAVVAAAIAAGHARGQRIVRACGDRLPVGADGIVRGAAAFELAGDPARAVLLLHGFGDTPQTLRYLAEHLHARGYTVRVPLLPGHGRTLEAFAASRAEEWLAAARTELDALRTRAAWVGLVGLSMGGALAAVLAADTPSLPALVLLAPYASMPNAARRLSRAHALWAPLAPYVAGGGTRSIFDPAEVERNLSYRAVTGRLVRELLHVVDRAQAALPRVIAPTLMVQSREDYRIPPAAAQRIFDRINAPEKRLIWIERSGHVITVDYGRERVFALVEDWLEAHGGKRHEERGIEPKPRPMP